MNVRWVECVVFGIGAASKIAFGVSHGVFPIIMTVSSGVQNIEPLLLTSAGSLAELGRWIDTALLMGASVPSYVERRLTAAFDELSQAEPAGSQS